MLLKYGADVNEHSGRSGTTALIEASQAGRLDIVKLLLQKGANIHAVDGYRFSALMLAAAHGHVHIVRVLIGRGAHINYRREITKFDQEDREEEEDSQLQFAYPPSYKVRGIRVDDPWETALQAASACSRDPNDDPMVDLLLENGAIS
jgi:ankyrin repeat protein